MVVMLPVLVLRCWCCCWRWWTGGSDGVGGSRSAGGGAGRSAGVGVTVPSAQSLNSRPKPGMFLHVTWFTQ